MNYEIIAKIIVTGVERKDALALIVGMQRNAVKSGLSSSNITLVRVTESPDQPAEDITSEAIAALQPPPPAWKVGDQDRRLAANPRRATVGVSPTGLERRTGPADRRIH